ncbi:MAG: FHA domain-containing protein [Chromatiales bacterium]|jgi:pSer/pThr/pTyr-binding forkhead associated (FHA) protein
MALLVMISDDGDGKRVPLDRQRVRIGRDPDSEVHLDDPSISRRHALLTRVYKEYFVEDQHSTNGTVLNGRKVFKHMLKHGDILEVGSFRFRYETDDEMDTAEADSELEETVLVGGDGVPAEGVEAPMREEAAPRATSAMPEASVRMLNGKHQGKRMVLKSPVLAIGPKGDRNAAVARKGNGFVLMQLGEGEPPRVNDQPVPRSGAPLKDGDLIEVAGRRMEFVYKG